MKKRILLVLALVSVVGCVDTPNSVCLEFRNANNEHIDALMMVTNETQAQRMSIRVFSKMSDRYVALDRKWEIMETNWGRTPDLDTMKAFLEADGLHLYRAEYRANAQRCTLELARLRNLVEQIKTREAQAAQDEGREQKPVSELCPSLNAMVHTPSVLGPLRMQLEKPKLEDTLSRFFGRIDVEKKEGKDVIEKYNSKFDTFTKLGPNRQEIVLAN